MSGRINWYFYCLSACLVAVLMSACESCLPKGCFGKLAELNEAKPRTEKAQMVDTNNNNQDYEQRRQERSPFRGGGAQGGQTPVCTEFVTMQKDDNILVIFVDKNAPANGSGASWQDAIRSVGQGLKRALEKQAQYIGANGLAAAKDIYVIIAGETYSQTHEITVRNQPAGNAPLLSMDGTDPQTHIRIQIRGGFRSGDKCLELPQNLQNDPNGQNGRDTIIEGEGNVNNVVDLADAKQIKLMNLTIQGGNARENIVALPLPFKKMGGAVIIRGASDHIEFIDVILKNSRALDKGGCLALIDGVHHITLTNVVVGENGQGCRAVNGGGGIFIGDTAYTVTANNLTVQHNRATAPASEGGGILIADQAGNAGVAYNLEFNNSTISHNESQLRGGGVSIKDTAQQISFSGTKINDNGVVAPVGRGGGVSIRSQIGLDGLRFVGAGVGTIEHNSAPFQGGGVYIDNASAAILAGQVKYLFTDMRIVRNEITGNNPQAGGAGLYITDANNIRMAGGSISSNGLVQNGNGAGLALFGNVTEVDISNVYIAGNHINIPGGGNGMGVWIHDNGGVNKPTNITLQNNTRIDGNFGAQNGGGLFAYKAKNLILRTIRITENKAAGNGAGLYVNDSYLAEHSNVIYAQNRAVQNGGALYADQINNAGNPIAAPMPMPMENIQCQRNSAGSDGGCAFIKRSPNTVINRGSYTQNGVPYNNGMGFIVGRTRRGGGLFYESHSLNPGNDNQAKLEVLNNASFTNNEADFGGGIYTLAAFDIQINGADFQNNHAQQDGGAAYHNFANYNNALNNAHHNGAKIILKKASLSTNRAGRNGGALYLHEGLKEFAGQGDAIAGAQFGANNQPTLPDDAFSRIQFTGNSAINAGGAIYFNGFTDILGVNTFLRLGLFSFAQNRAMTGGALAIVNPPERIQFSEWIMASDNTDPANVANRIWREFDKCIFQGNIAQAGGGINIAATAPRAIDHFLTSFQTTFEDNQALTGDGGALRIEANVDINNLDLNAIKGRYKSNVSPQGVGGALAFFGNWQPGLRIRFEGTLFEENSSMRNPGVHFAHIPQGGFWFSSAVLKNNESTQAGPGGFLDLSLATIADLWFTGLGGEISTNRPQVATRGGAFAVGRIQNTLRISNQTVSGFHAQQDGGFISVFDQVNAINQVQADDSEFSYNQALGSDGGVFSLPRANFLSLNNIKFTGNTAFRHGGALAMQLVLVQADIIATAFTGNQAVNGNGGGSYISRARNVNITAAAGSLERAIKRFLNRFLGYFQGVLHADEDMKRSIGNTAHLSGGIYYFQGIGQNLTVDNQAWLKNNATTGNGGTLYAQNIVQNATISNSLLYKNNAHVSGGAIYIERVNDFTLESPEYGVPADRRHAFNLFPSDLALDILGKGPQYRIVAGDFFGRMGQVLSNEETPQQVVLLQLANPDGTFTSATILEQIPGQHPVTVNKLRGQFLVEENIAQTGNGGALYLGRANNITMTRMPFGNNKAPQGLGGTVFINNFSQNLSLDNSIMYGGRALGNAGCLYARGTNLAALRHVRLSDSSIQDCQVANGVATGGSAGVYLERINSLAIDETNFFDNTVLASQGGLWTGALKFNDRASPNLPPVNAAWVPGALVHPLANINDMVPFFATGPIELKGNVVPAGVNNIGTISIPNAIRITAAQYFVYNTPLPLPGPGTTPFDIANNQPAPADAQPLNVVTGH